MDPIFEYFEIIVNRLQNPLPKTEYGERHHIYPKSCGGSNDKFNLVRLTPEEHYRCHCLLPEILNDDPEDYKKMIYAWHAVHTTHNGISISEEEYGKLKRSFCDIRKKWKCPNETKKRISETLKRKGIKPPSRKGCAPANKGKGKKNQNKESKPRIPWNKGIHNEKTRDAVLRSWAKRKAAQHLQS